MLFTMQNAHSQIKRLSLNNTKIPYTEHYMYVCCLSVLSFCAKTKNKSATTKNYARERAKKSKPCTSTWKLSTYIMNVQHKRHKSHFHLSIAFAVAVWFVANPNYYCFYRLLPISYCWCFSFSNSHMICAYFVLFHFNNGSYHSNHRWDRASGHLTNGYCSANLFAHRERIYFDEPRTRPSTDCCERNFWFI